MLGQSFKYAKEEALKQLHALYKRILTKGEISTDRTGTGTYRIIGEKLDFSLRNGRIPYATTKRLPVKVVNGELFWFIRGERNIRTLVQNNINIWNEWPFSHYLLMHGIDPKKLRSENPTEWNRGIKNFAKNIAESEDFAHQWGDLGPVYGFQWRHWQTPTGEIDQLAEAINTIKSNPDSRRIVVTAWNPADVPAMVVSGLPPCHMDFEFYVVNGKLTCTMHQRSVDSFLGLPFNIASYALLTHMVAHVTGLIPDKLTLFLGDTHIYLNHVDQVKEQLSRKPRALPKVRFAREVDSIDEFLLEDVIIEDYDPHPTIKGEISV